MTPSPPLSLESVVCARSNQVSSRVDDELVVLDLDSSLYFALDPVGARIFELVQTPTPLEAVLDQVVAEFEVDAAVARADLLSLVASLVEERLVEVRAGHAP
jgi:hypothetical protein